MSARLLGRTTLDALAPVFAGRTHEGSAFEVFDRLAGIDPLVWQAVFPPSWKDYRYFRTLEETFAEEFPPRYLVLREAAAAGTAPGAAPVRVSRSLSRRVDTSPEPARNR